ncbi:molybdate ABC transporter permease subunit [Pontibacillus sp. HMF3514]|uniref:molybdate ABC transporter permease subunit n=1 Tax=Pontibacillus sp. HMF3514 TaxID=2692425 RepID=UPI00131F9915|nr:molybdate ABC transporter permease subunit [Pontibacillus sp. HMF3514]QHE51302.1 molybdate ABC transporter permease subunit [Pontibacillus sp. HMF3514]
MNLDPLWLSLKIASISSLIVFVVGTLLARWLSRRHFRGKNLLESAILLPMVLPPTVVGFGLLYMFGKNGVLGKWLQALFDMQLVFTWYAAVIASVIVSFPLMYQSAAAAFKNYNPNLENAAYTMGASKMKVFWTISLPLAWPGLLAGLVLSFSRALGEFGATLMFAGYIPGKTDTLPIAIYFAVEAGNSQAALWLVLIMVVIGFGTVYWLNRWNKRQSIWITGVKDEEA